MQNPIKKVKITGVILLGILLSLGLFYAYKWPYRLAEKTPFENVYWKGDEVWVALDGLQYQWIAAEGISIENLADFAKSHYGIRWKDRLQKDYMQVLKEMGVWTFFSTEVTLKTKAGKEIQKTLRLSETKRLATRDRIFERQHVTREHSDTIPDAFSYLVYRMDGYEKPNNAQWLSGPVEFDFKTSMTDWIPAEMAAKDLENLEWELQHQYAYAELKAVDIQQVIDVLRADLKSGISRRDFGTQIKRLLALFGDGPSSVSRSFLEIDNWFLPFRIRKIDGKYVALASQKLWNTEYPELLSIDGISIDSLKQKAGEMVAQGSPQFMENASLKYIGYYGYLQQQLHNKQRQTCAVQLCNENDTIVTSVGLLDKASLIAKSERRKTQYEIIEGNIGYLYLHKMEKDIAYQDMLRKAMEDFRDTDGIIIDIRGNGGGNRLPIYTLLPYFLKTSKVINVNALRIDASDDPQINEPIGDLEKRMSYPEHSTHWRSHERQLLEAFKTTFKPQWPVNREQFSQWHYAIVNPGDHHYSNPVVILMDADNFSASDIFLAAFKGSPNCTLMGAASSGGSGFTRFRILSRSGIVYRLSRMASFQPNGHLYDGQGVLPDIKVLQDMESVKQERDKVLERAKSFIKSQ